jgi:hypothetical protein
MRHTGFLNYLNRLHRKYGRDRYAMYLIETADNGRMTVEFKEKNHETQG